MAEEETPPEPPKEDPPKVDPLPPLKGLTDEDLKRLETKLRDELHELHSADKQEREQLRNELAELKEYKEKQELAQQERDKVKDSDSTMVLPPTDIPPQQPNVDLKPEDQGIRKGRWKKAW